MSHYLFIVDNLKYNYRFRFNKLSRKTLQKNIFFRKIGIIYGTWCNIIKKKVEFTTKCLEIFSQLNP